MQRQKWQHGLFEAVFSPSKLHTKSHIPVLRVLKNVFPLPFVSLLYGSRDNGILSVGLSIDCRSPELPESCRWAQPRKWSFPALILTIFTPQHGHFYPSMWSHGLVSAITNVRCRQVSDIGNAAEDVNIMEKKMRTEVWRTMDYSLLLQNIRQTLLYICKKA